MLYNNQQIICHNPHLVNLYGEITIGENLQLGAFIEIQDGVKIGSNVRIGSHTFIPTGTVIGDNVFIGQNVSICNDRYPQINNKNFKLEPVIIKDYVVIGSGVTILCGITLEKGCFVGAGSTVTRNIPRLETWVGNPAKRLA